MTHCVQATSQCLRMFSTTPMPTENPMQVALDQILLEKESGNLNILGGASTYPTRSVGDTTEIFPKQHDIYEESFKNLLKDFCHNYQIPFLENNLPKSCRQAAKIFYCLMEDDRDKGIPE